MEVPIVTDGKLEAQDKWGAYDISGYTRLCMFAGHRAIDFHTAWRPPLRWLKKVAKNNPKLEFELGWYELGSQEYGHYRIKHKNYKESSRFSIIDGDITEIYENPGSKPTEERSSERFVKVIGRVGLTYEAGI